MKIFDCFMYFDEEVVLDLRLNTLDKYVDYFVIVESKFTHRGEQRNLKFNHKKFEKFKNKIIYKVFTNPPERIESINDDDINEVIKVLKSEMIRQGPLVERFEKTFCSYTSSNYSVLTNSATSALHIACLALGLSEGDVLWTSPNSCLL